LDLFLIPATQTSVESEMYVDYHPALSITGGAPIEFDVNATGEEYLDLVNSLLHVRAKIVKANGENMEAASTVGPVNNFLHSLFSQVDVSMNGTLITSSTNTYAYRVYIKTLLSYGSDAKSSQLTSALFYKAEAGKMDKPTPFAADDGDKNSGLIKRQTFAARISKIDKIGGIHSDIRHIFRGEIHAKRSQRQDKLISSNDALCLVSTGGTQFKVVVTFASLLIRKVKISPSCYLAHAKSLETGTVKYPIRRVICKTLTLPTGYLDASHEKLFSGQLPIRLIVGLVDNRAYNGDREKNPFNFHHYSLNEIAVYL
jgi:hypothetical protein